MDFVKLHGYGNDYLVFEAGALAPVGWRGGFDRYAEDEAFPNFVRRVCDRHYGAGSDGVAVVERLGRTGPDKKAETVQGEETEAIRGDETEAAQDERLEADFALRIFNPDGGEAAMSGNGSRCAAACLHFEGLWTGEELRFLTRAGVKRYVLRGREGAHRFHFEAEIGCPLFDSASIPMLTLEPLTEVRGYPLAFDDGDTLTVTALQMCNPNCCLFVDDFESLDWRRIGRLVESHAAFPERTNVEFVRVADRRTIDARVWERGAGETLSSGTGACAAAVASMVNHYTDRHVVVRMPGGALEVLWREDGEVLLTGTAQVVYRGRWEGGLLTNDE
jgi:diaminopimelate epimerase